MYDLFFYRSTDIEGIDEYQLIKEDIQLLLCRIAVKEFRYIVFSFFTSSLYVAARTSNLLSFWYKKVKMIFLVEVSWATIIFNDFVFDLKVDKNELY